VPEHNDDANAPRDRYSRLYKLVCDSLWTHWDPLGINKYSRASDEYDAFAPDVVRLLIQDSSSPEAIVEYLSCAEADLVEDTEERRAQLLSVARWLINQTRDLE